MKRHPALIPLSRDHHNGLVQTSRLRRAGADGDAAAWLVAAREFVEFFRNEERDHLRDEEEGTSAGGSCERITGMGLRQEDFFGALNERNAHAKCPVCNRKEWVAMGPSGQAQRIVLPTGEPGTVDLDAGFPVAGRYCSNCGFVCLHRLDSLGL